MGTHKIICGKSEIELKQFEDNTFDSCVCDPPYNLTSISKRFQHSNIENEHYAMNANHGYGRLLRGSVGGFMGKEWDSTGIPFKVELWQEVYRVVKPGAHILVAGIARTHHRMWVALEDAGFDIIDGVYHIFGSGFPKSLDIPRNIDKIKNEEPKIIGKNENARNTCGNINICKKNGSGVITAPVSEEAKQFEGFGTQLKPAVEIWCLARKPISERNIAANVLKWGVGGLNIGGCRIGYQSTQDKEGARVGFNNIGWKHSGNTKEKMTLLETNLANQQGRFPANLILDEEAGRMLDDQSGELTSGEMNSVAKGGQFAVYGYQYPRETVSYGSKGGASRFFYQAKASQNERWFYCMICKKAYPMKERDKHIHNAPEKTKYQFLEFHPTQKPEDLIGYLMQLITPPNGTTIDPFLGSGTAIIAAEREGFNCAGIDSKPEYCEMGYVRGKAELVQQKISGEQSTIERIRF